MASKSFGQIAGTVVGAAVGFFMPGAYVALGASIGGMIGGMIDPPKGPTVVGPRLDDLSFQTSTLGAPLGRAYGTVPVLGNVVWLEGDKYREVITSEEQGGKGGPTSAYETAHYYATFAVSLLRVTDATKTVALRRLWIGSNLVYDAGSDNLESIIASNSQSALFTFYSGSDDQQPNTRWQADKGANAVSGFPGRCYIVIYDLDLEPYSRSLAMAQVKAELSVSTGTVTTEVIESIFTGNLGDPTWGNSIGLLGVNFTASGADYVTFERENYGDNPRLLNFGAMEFPYSEDVVSDDILAPEGGYGYAHSFLLCRQADEKIALQKQVELNGYSNILLRWFSIGESTRWHDYLDDSRMLYGDHSYVVFDLGETFLAGDNPSAHVVKVDRGGSIIAATSTKYVIRQFGASENYIFALLYTPSTDNLTTTVYKFDRDSLALIDTYTESAVGGRGAIHVIDDDTFYTAAWKSGYGGHIYKWVGGVVVEDYGNIFTTGVGDHSRLHVVNDSPPYGYLLNHLSSTNSPDIVVFYPQIQSSVAKLRDIVTSECGLAGVASGDIDLAGLTDSDVRGYRIANAGAVRSSLEMLQAAFPFDVSPSGYKLRFVSRGTASLATVTESDLGATSGGNSLPVLLPVSREMDTQIPYKVSVRYLDPAREYDIGEQYASRPDTASVSERTVELSLVLTGDEAVKIADVLNQKDWVERSTFGPFSLPPTWRALEPPDVVTVEHRGQSHTLRLTRAEFLPDGRIECAGVPSSAQSYTSSATAQESLTVGQSLVPLKGSTQGLLIDIPLILDQQNAPGISAAVYGMASGWPGGSILRSEDSGNSYQSAFSSNAAASVFRATTALATGRADIIDAANVLTVAEVSRNPSLSSVSFASAAAGQNIAAIGADGRWEIISFMTVTDNADDTWTIRDFMRGRFGTEWAMVLHETGDLMVMLSPPSVGFVGLPMAAINSTRLYRSVTQGAAIDSADDVYYTYGAANLKPLAPIRLNGSRNPSSLDWTMSAIRRSRTPVEPFSGIATPIGEASEVYDVEIWNSDYSVLKRTFSGLTAATATYTAAQQIADFGAEQSTLYIKWHPLSATVGRGLALAESIYRYLPLDPYGDLVTLLLHMDDTGLTDVMGNSVAMFGNVAREADAAAFGGYWAAFDGTGDYLRIPYSSALDIGSGDFTVQVRVKITAYRTYASPICGTYTYGSVDGGTQNDGWELGILSDGKLFFGFGTGDSSFTYFSSASAVGIGSIKSLGVKRVGDDFTLTVDGSSVGTYNSSVDFTRTKSYFYVGSYNRGDSDAFSANVSFNGKVEELRITNGVGRDLSVVPTAAFPNP